MKELVEAYNVLNASDKRKEYDNQPQFKIRRSKKAAKGRKAADLKSKKTKKAPSLLEKISAMFGKKGDSKPTDHYDEKQGDVHFTLGITMAETDSFMDQAKNEFKQSIKFDPLNKEAQYNLGLVCYKLGEFDEALVNFQKVLTHEKEDQHARIMISLLREDEY